MEVLQMSKELNSIKYLNVHFNIGAGQKLVKIYTCKDETQAHKFAVYTYMKILEYDQELPKGYMTKIKNGNIKFETLEQRYYAMQQLLDSSYEVYESSYGDTYLIGLTKRVI